MTNRHSYNVREEEEEFRSCVRCWKPVYDEARGYHALIEKSMDEKLQQSKEGKGFILCKILPV